MSVITLDITVIFRCTSKIMYYIVNYFMNIAFPFTHISLNTFIQTFSGHFQHHSVIIEPLFASFTFVF